MRARAVIILGSSLSVSFGGLATAHDIECTLPRPMRCVHYHGPTPTRTGDLDNLIKNVDDTIEQNEEVLQQERADRESGRDTIPEEREEAAEKYLGDLRDYREDLERYDSEHFEAADALDE